MKKPKERSLGRPVGRNGQETRDLIVSLAARSVSQNGFDNLRLHLIAREAGITRAAIYHHFASKEELIEAVLVEGHDNFEQLRCAVEAACTPLEKLLAFIDTSRQLQHDDYRYHLAFLSLIEHSRNPERFKEVRKNWERSVALLHGTLDSLLGAQPFLGEEEAHDAVDIVSAMLIGGLTILSFLRKESKDYGAALEIIKKMLVNACAPAR